MTAEDLRTQFDYGYWANAKLFGVASSLTTEEFTQPVSGSYGSIRNTLVHMMSTEWGWMERSGGFRRGPKLSASDFPTFASVRERWEEVEAHVRRTHAASSTRFGMTTLAALWNSPSAMARSRRFRSGR